MSDIIKFFKTTFDAEPAKDLICNISDITFSKFLHGTELDSIPIISYLNSVRKITTSIQEYRLARKLYNFVFYIRDLSAVEKAEFIVEYEYINQENAYEALFSLIDRIDNTKKIAILSNLIRARILGKISIEDFVRLTIVLERIPYPDINKIKNYIEDYYEPGVTDILNAAGILYQSIIDANDTGKFKLNSIGEQFLKFGLCYENIQLKGTYNTDINGAIGWEDIKDGY